MADTCLKPVQGLAIRIARLDATGATPSGATNSVVLDAFVRLEATPEIQAGQQVTVTAANGRNCIDRRTPDRYRWWNVTLTLCGNDPASLELLTGALLIGTTGSAVGFGVPLLNTDIGGSGVSIEVWTYALDATSQPDGVTPYYRFALPKTYSWVLGPVTIENGAQTQALTGVAVENALWGNGPANDWTGPTGAAARAIMAKLDTAIPVGACGYTAVPAQI